MVRWTLAFLAVLTLVGGAPLCVVSPAAAQSPSTPRDLAAPARWAVNQVVYASTSTSAAAERAIDSRINEQRRSIEALRGRITQAGGRNEALSADLSTAQERYSADLAERDRAYAQEIAVLRGAAEDIAATPEGLVALERFNAGDELGALLALDRLRDARERARQVRNNIESAAEGRNIATLALEARNRGRLDLASVITRYEEVTRLDPGVFRDWVELGRLQREAGQLLEAQESVRRARDVATSAQGLSADTTWNLSLALELEGDLALARGDLQGARTAAAANWNALRAFAASSMDPVAMFNATNSLVALGDVLLLQGEFDAASAHFEQSLSIYRQLTSVLAGWLEARRAVGTALERLGDVEVARANTNEGRRRFTDSLAEWRTLLSEDPNSVRTLAGLARIEQRIGDLEFEAGDLASAREHFDVALRIERRFAEPNAATPLLQRQYGVLLQRMGNVLLREGDLRAARAHYEESLVIFRRLLEASPELAEAHRDIWVAMMDLAKLPDGADLWPEVVRAMEEADRRGFLGQQDRSFLTEARLRAQAASQRLTTE